MSSKVEKVKSVSNSAIKAMTLVSTLLSVAGVFAAFYYHLISSITWCTIIGGVFFIIAIVCTSLKEKYPFCKQYWIISWIVVVLLVVACVLVYKHVDLKKDNERLADVTESFVELAYHKDSTSDWIPTAYEEGNLVCLLVDSELEEDEFIRIAFNIKEVVRNSSDPEIPDFKCVLKDSLGAVIKTKYVLSLAYAPYLKDSFDDKRVIRMPESVMIVSRGMDLMNAFKFEQGKALLEKADSLGNPSAAYYLSRLYGSGWGREPQLDTSNYYLQRAAMNGSRTAKRILGKSILSKSSDFPQPNEGEAIDYLTSASLIQTFGSESIVNNATDALYFLSNYYRDRGNPKRAYRLSSDFLDYFDDPAFKYTFHLSNCFAAHKDAQAMEIVREGERNNNPYCYAAHAQMLMEGVGFEKDYGKAESLLRFTADSLHYGRAYLLLAELYDRQGRPGADFFRGLYNVNFTPEVK